MAKWRSETFEMTTHFPSRHSGTANQRTHCTQRTVFTGAQMGKVLESFGKS